MGRNAVLERLDAGQVLVGLCNMYPAAGIIEAMCPGWDFVWIDCQHGQHDYISALTGIRTACSVGVETVLRVPSAGDGAMIRYLDADPSVLMVPMMNSAEEARALVRAVHFPPRGERSYGGRRMVDLHGREYFSSRRLAVMAQIETVRAVAAAEAIIATDGIDLLFFSGDDLKLSMGLDINALVTQTQALAEAMAAVAEAARKAGKFCGLIAPDIESLAMARLLGYQLIVAGVDVGFLRSQSARQLSAFRAALGGGPQA